MAIRRHNITRLRSLENSIKKYYHINRYIREIPNAWIEALKEYNKGSNSWCVVKKGTAEYDKVKKIMENIKNPIKKTQ